MSLRPRRSQVVGGRRLLLGTTQTQSYYAFPRRPAGMTDLAAFLKDREALKDAASRSLPRTMDLGLGDM